MTTQQNEVQQEETQTTFQFDGPENTSEAQPADAPTEPVETAEVAQVNSLPPVGAPPEVPVAGMPPEVSSPPQPAYNQAQVAELQAEHQRQQEMIQQYQAQMEERQYEGQIAQEYQGFVDLGASHEQAQVMVQRMRQPYDQLRETKKYVTKLEQSQQLTIMGAKAMISKMLEVSRKYGVSPESLQNYDSPQAMEAAAAASKNYQDMRKEITSLKQGRVPAGQHFESGQGQGISSTSARRQQLRNKQGPLTDAEFTELGKYLGQG